MIERSLNLSKILGITGSAFLFGARGTGKTLLARSWIKAQPASFEVNLLDPDSYQRYLREPSQLERDIEGALQKSSQVLSVFIDEAQKLPLLLDVVHQLYSLHQDKIRFLLTGSSARKLKRGGANLLAGRLYTLNLYPLCYQEYQISLELLLRLGSLPGVVLHNEDPERALRAYVHTYLKEEVLEEALVRKVDAFARFLEVAGQYHGKIINARQIGKAVGLSNNTIAEYFQILQDTLIGFMLPGWSASTKKQLRTAPKFFLFDNGVANALRGELRIELTERTSRYGELFETYVLQELLRLNEYEQLDLKFSYWQTNTHQEVDLILSRGMGEPLAAIEIKSGTLPNSSDWKGLYAFAKEYPDTKLFCFCRTPHRFTGEGNVQVVPWTEAGEVLGTV